MKMATIQGKKYKVIEEKTKGDWRYITVNGRKAKQFRRGPWVWINEEDGE